MPRSGLHYARLEHSPRLRRVLNILSDRRPHTTRNIQRLGEVCAVNSIVSELRANGFEIDCTCKRRGRYVYRLKSLTKSFLAEAAARRGKKEPNDRETIPSLVSFGSLERSRASSSSPPILICLIIVVFSLLIFGGCSSPDEMTVGVFGAETNYGQLGEVPTTGVSLSFTWKLKSKSPETINQNTNQTK